jgi:hypothetical protein
MHFKRTTYTAVAIAVGVAFTLAGCSSGGHGGSPAGNVTSTMTPSAAVTTAVKNLGAQSSVEMVFSLGLTAAQVEELRKSGGGTPPTPAEAQALSTGSIFLTAATGHGEGLSSAAAQTDAQRSFDLGLTIGSDTPFEVRYVDQNLYLRVQIQKLLSDVGQNPTSASKFTSEVSSLNSVVPGLSSLAAGNWVEISHASLDSLGSTLKQAAGSTSSSSSPSSLALSEGQMARLAGQLVGALEANSTFTSLGSSSGRDEYSMTLNVSAFAKSALTIIQPLYSSIPVVGTKIGGSVDQAQAKIPANLSAMTDLFVSDNRLSEADLDANQFEHKYSFPIPLKAVFSSPGAPAAPSGATNLDLSKLPALLGNLVSGLTKSSSGA